MKHEELRRRLVEALTEFGKKKETKVVRERGEPISNPFFWPDPEFGNVERELFSLVDDGWESGWAIDDRSMQRMLRRLIWDALGDSSKENQIEAVVDTFLEKLAIKFTSFTAVVAIQGLRPAKSPIKIGEVTFGTLSDLVDEKSAKEILVSSGGKAPQMWASLRVDAPSESLVADSAARDVESALDLLATLHQRHHMSTGHPGDLRVGSFGFVVSGTQLLRSGFRNEWLRGVGYSVDPDVLVKKHSRYRSGPYPWYDLPADSEFSSALAEAYRRFGHACRLRDDPEAAIPLAVSALESLLSERDDKLYSTTARVILASVMLDEPTMWPIALVGWFLTRHEILHEPFQFRWSEQEASKTFWSLYGVLDLIASFILEGKIRQKKDLLLKLEAQENVEQAVKGVDREVAGLKELQTNALTGPYRQMLGAQIEVWGHIRKKLKSGIR